jgi:hypothetical protein
MSKYLHLTLALTLSLCLAPSANASAISIIEDYTSASAQVTFDPGMVSDPGTTLDTFSGALFPSAAFTGYNLVGDRAATVQIDDETFDTTAYSAVNNASIYVGYYQFAVNLGADAFNMYGATGSASGETDLNLKFQVTGGDSAVDLFATFEGGGSVSLALYDETDSVSITSLAPTSYGQESAHGVTLLDNHIYSLTGSLYAVTPFKGDPCSNFGFRFADELTVAKVPEPGAISLLLLGLIGMGLDIYRRKNASIQKLG